MVESCSQSDALLDQLPLRVSLSVPPCHFICTEYSLPQEEMQVRENVSTVDSIQQYLWWGAGLC